MRTKNDQGESLAEYGKRFIQLLLLPLGLRDQLDDCQCTDAQESQYDPRLNHQGITAGFGEHKGFCVDNLKRNYQFVLYTQATNISIICVTTLLG